MGRMVFFISAVLLLSSASWGFSEKKSTVFWLDEQYQPKVNLKPLMPLSEGMKAILALYAMRASTGCDVDPDKEDYLKCKLTSELGLGRQCSEAELNLVRAWFKKGIPPINISEARIDEILKSGDFRLLCNDVPDTATHRSMWEILKVEPMGDRVKIDARGSWTAGPGASHGRFRYETIYQILSNRVNVLSHKEMPAGRKNR